MVARGYSSLSFLHSAATEIASKAVPTFIIHLSDFDPSGVDAGNKINETLRERAPDAEIHFKRLAVTPEQIDAWNLPTRPTKVSDTRAKGFGPVSAELDAIEPDLLRDLLNTEIQKHMPAARHRLLAADEARERLALQNLVEELFGEEGGLS